MVLGRKRPVGFGSWSQLIKRLPQINCHFCTCHHLIKRTVIGPKELLLCHIGVHEGFREIARHWSYAKGLTRQPRPWTPKCKRKCISHAWIEIDDNVINHSSNQAILATAEDYFKDNDAVACRRFSREEAGALLSYLRGQEGFLPVGYWGNLSGEDVACAMGSYHEASGVFASGVCFSDPSGPSNASNLQRHGKPSASWNDKESK